MSKKDTYIDIIKKLLDSGNCYRPIHMLWKDMEVYQDCETLGEIHIAESKGISPTTMDLDYGYWLMTEVDEENFMEWTHVEGIQSPEHWDYYQSPMIKITKEEFELMQEIINNK